ncbi:HCLS1 protein, partial [Corythaixoides concolor]|nr:HCLS1 protein [Corythaixoides concolor]
MWKAVVGHDVSVKVEAQGDDWDTDPDFVVSVWSGCTRQHNPTVTCPDSLCLTSIHQLRNKVSEEHEVIKKKELETGPKASYGYGGKFGTERDRMDKCAVGHEYVADVGKHSSQTDAAQGFGGKYGVQRDRADKSALGFEYKGEVEKHSSQKGKSMGTYYSKGFGGRYGVERDKVDKAAVGFDYKSQAEKHNSQKDYAKGFGGRYGVQKDRVDKSAAGFNEMAAPTSSYEKTRPLEAASSGTSSLRSRFENMAKSAEEESRRQAEEGRARRQAQECQAARQKVSRGHLAMSSRADKADFSSGPCSLESFCLDDLLPKLLPSNCQGLPWNFIAVSGKSHRERRTMQRQPLPPCQQGCPGDEETPPTLPPRPADLGEELGKIPSQDQPIYSEGLDVGGDYEEVPEHSDYYDSTSGGADYEELPAPLEKLDAIYDQGGDGGDMDNVYEGENPGTCAVALYDYQGDGDDEISFDPDDTITHIEMVDEGWWRGQCRGKVGLFPANYVKLLQ